ncbi:prolyl oligopeptidase family serine peptidase [Hymenobacter cellulosilyticus]|uniref:prolyl oligopeptidase n=1 Tax=Hymenobacter cellulosilyticus TaxID=2932248 RepID=A0A8T9Q220_9BACT|nr:prolyl oligopeptidase family serine peptidase [Hymenobacter cellulosilyticus]UOQ71467.1 prolyl oligopeptidase family serine peptidase [Hymenobacter cellulosilyticus]
MKTSVLALVAAAASLAAQAQPSLPATPKRPVTDTYFGQQVTDNYRWLEDLKSPETQAWFKAQGDYTAQVMAGIPGRDSLINTLVRYDALKAARITGILRRGGRYFYKKTLPSENVGKLYYRTGTTGPEVLLFDPSTYAKGKSYAVSYFLPSEDGRRLALGVAEGGAEISTIRVLNVDTKKLYPESIYPSWFGVSGWTPDGKGFIYTTQQSGDTKSMNMLLNTRSLYHTVGTPVAQDRELFSRAKYKQLPIKPEDLIYVTYSEDFKYIMGNLGGVDRRMNAFIAPATELLQPTINWKRLAAPADSVLGSVVLHDRLYLLSTKRALKGRILVTDARQPNLKTATVALPMEKRKIETISAAKDYLLATLNDGLNTTAKQFSLRTNRWEDVPLPLTGSAEMQVLEPTSNDCLLYLTSWKQPPTIYTYNPVTKEAKVSPFDTPVTYPGLADLVVEEVEVPGLDGTPVPLSIIYNKKVKRDGRAVCFMTGYGAYGISADPYFSSRTLALLNQGVIVAETHVRGGSEKGQAWHKAGMKTTKPNTWRDFIACGEYLVKNGYTSPQHLIGEGTSAGGILIGRAITERPDLFAAAISNVGLSNMLRFENTPNGPNNAKEFGTVKDSVECRALYEMDAFLHVQPGTNYPAVISVGGMNDPRVIAWQPGKFAAALQAASTSGKPVLMQVNFDNGHFTEDKKVAFRNFANMYAFALWQAGHPNFQPSPVAVK